MKRLFTQVAEVYAAVNDVLPVIEGNPCGDCRSCCSAEMETHMVNELEFATLQHTIGEAKSELFRRYLVRERSPEGELVFPMCPMLNELGCSIHEHRPLSCRLYGHYRETKAFLFSHCVFRGQETVIPKERCRQEMPGNIAISELTRQYLSLRPASEQPKLTVLTALTDSDKASALMMDEDHEGAIRLLEALSLQDSGLTEQRMLALAYEFTGRLEKAVVSYQRLIKLAPDNPQFHCSLGCSFFRLARYTEAIQALSRSQELAPSQALAIGYLGTVYAVTGELEKAEKLLLEAIELECSPGPFRYQLGAVYKQMGKTAKARRYFLKAKEHELSRDAAIEALA